MDAQGVGTVAPAAVRRAVARLALEVWLYHHGWALPLATLLVAAALALAAFAIVPTGQRIAALDKARLAAAVPAAAAAAAPPAEPGRALRMLLAAADPAPAQMARVAALARRHGIELPQGHYRTSVLAASGIVGTEVTLRYAAAYPQARAFVVALLRELPNASVDRVSFERDRSDGSVAVAVQLTLWRLAAEGAR